MIRLVATLCVACSFAPETTAHAATHQPGEVPQTLVMPFDDPADDPKLYWLGEGSAVLLSELLERYGRQAIAREERLAAFDRLQLPPAAALSHATVIKVGQLVRATNVVVGSYELSDNELTVRARSIDLDAGRMTPEVVQRGPLSGLFGIYETVARQLRDATVPAPAPRAGTLLTSLHGFELYVKGLVAESPSAQRTFLEQAITVVPSDDRIKLALWSAHAEAGNHQAALSAATSVPPGSPQRTAAQYLVARSQIELKQYDEAFATLQALSKQIRSAEVQNALGVVQVRRGATPPAGRAVYYFSQASQLDPADVDYFFNLGYGYWLDKDPPAAVYWLREAVRRDPADADAHLVLSAALQQTGATAEAARERELAARLSGGEQSAAPQTIPRGLERLKDYLHRSAARVDAILTSSGQRDQAELALHHLEAGRRAFDREAARESERELRRALFLSPYLADAHVLLGRLFMRAGRTADAIQAFRIALWSEETADAHVYLAEAYLAAQNVPAARDELSRALMLDPDHAAALALRVKIGQ